MRQIPLRLDDELMARLELRARELGQTRTEFVRRALLAALTDDASSKVSQAVDARPSPRSLKPRVVSSFDLPFNPQPKRGS